MVFLFVSVLIQEKKKKNLYQTLLCNTHTVFQAAQSAQHPDLDVSGREFHDTTYTSVLQSISLL